MAAEAEAPEAETTPEAVPATEEAVVVAAEETAVAAADTEEVKESEAGPASADTEVSATEGAPAEPQDPASQS